MSAVAGDPQPQGRVPRSRGGSRGQPHGPARRGGLPARPERRRQDDHPADDRRRAGAGRRHRHVQQRADLHADASTGPRRWHRPRHRGTAGVHEDVGPRQPAPRWRFGRRRAGAVPGARTATVGPGRDALGRRATDAGPRPGAEPQPVDPARRRAVARAGAEDRRPPARRGPDGGRRARDRSVDRRAARPQGAEVRRPDVPDGARPDPARAPRRRGDPTPRRDRGGLPAGHLGDRGGPPRAAAPEEQEEAVEAPAGSRARAGTAHREDRLHQEGRR